MTDQEREALLDEAASLLTRGESADALKVLRRLEGLVNVWQCICCSHRSSKVSNEGCPMCSGEMVAVVVRAFAASPAEEKPAARPGVLTEIPPCPTCGNPGVYNHKGTAFCRNKLCQQGAYPMFPQDAPAEEKPKPEPTLPRCLICHQPMPQGNLCAKCWAAQGVNTKAEEKPKPLPACPVCGASLTIIRGKHPGEDNRPVCATCLQERLETIHEMSERDYGIAKGARDGKVEDRP